MCSRDSDEKDIVMVIPRPHLFAGRTKYSKEEKLKTSLMRIALTTVVMMAVAGAATAQGMGVYGGLNLGFGQFGADVEQRTVTGINPADPTQLTYGTTTHKTGFNAFALTPTVGITPWRGNGNFVQERMAFEFQLAMKWGKYDYSWAAISGSEIRPGVLAKFNFSFADWAELFGNSGPAWGDRLATYVGLGFGIPIRTAEISYSSSYKQQIEAPYQAAGVEVSLPDTKTTKSGFQILMEYGLNFKVNDKFSLNWAMAGLGFIGHFTYDMTFGGNYHFK